MNLTDSDILELTELCNAVIDGTLSDPQKLRLSHWLSTSEDARQFYVRVTGLSASLFHYAGEMQTGEPDRTIPLSGARGRAWKWMFGIIAMAACVAIVWRVGWVKHQQPPIREAASGGTNVQAITPINEDEFVASLSGSKECEWGGGVAEVPLWSRLRKGQQIELTKGFAEITFDSGAKVVLQGPALFDLTSAWAAKLARGTLKASVPPQAVGFTISNDTVEVTDLGTEFTMFANSGGTATDVMVLKGLVEAKPRTAAASDQDRIKLKEKEFRRFAAGGVQPMDDQGQAFDELTQPMLLKRLERPIGYAHWSFDQPEGGMFSAVTARLPTRAGDENLRIVPSSAADSVHTRGRFQHAIRFDGNVYATAAFPGISKNAPHTIAFWVKIPKDAILSSAYSMVAWGTDSKKFGSHPFHICWNRNANEGTVGVLRTDHSRGYALGSTPLRDGRWHHIAVVFIPRDNAESPMEVKQYVDGRLEGEGRPSEAGSDVFMSDVDRTPITSGTIWLGCRLGTRMVRTDRFIGEMDELLIADRALEQQEIARLMIENRVDD